MSSDIVYACEECDYKTWTPQELCPFCNTVLVVEEDETIDDVLEEQHEFEKLTKHGTQGEDNEL